MRIPCLIAALSASFLSLGLAEAVAGESAVYPMEFEAVFEKPIDDDYIHTWEHSVLFDGKLYIAAWGLLAVDVETGEFTEPIGETARRRHSILPTREGLALASENTANRSLGFTKLRLIKSPGEPPAWEKEIGVGGLASDGGVLFLLDGAGTVIGLDVSTGKKLFRITRPQDADLPKHVTAVELDPSMLPVRPALLVLSRREERRIVKAEDVPKGMPYSSEAGMPEGMVYYVQKRLCVVRSYKIPGTVPEAEACNLAWRYEVECPEFLPGPSLFGAAEGKVQLFAGNKSVSLDIGTGKELSRATRDLPVTLYEQASPDTVIQLYDGLFRCIDLRSLAEKWKIPSGDMANLEGCAVTDRGVVTMCVDSTREDDMIIETDAILRLHDSATGTVLAFTKVQGIGSTRLFCHDNSVFLHGGHKLAGFKIARK